MFEDGYGREYRRDDFEDLPYEYGNGMDILKKVKVIELNADDFKGYHDITDDVVEDVIRKKYGDIRETTKKEIKEEDAIINRESSEEEKKDTEDGVLGEEVAIEEDSNWIDVEGELKDILDGGSNTRF